MTPWLAGLAAAAALGGAGLIVIALRRPAQATQRRGRGAATTGRVAGWWRRISPPRRALLAGAMIAGVVLAGLTRWLPALVIVPALVAGLPVLLADPPNRDIVVLAALDRWVRALTASLLTGRSVPDAVRATRRQAPAALAEAVTLAAMRLDERWPLPDVMAAFGNDVDHPEADAVAAALVVAGQRGTGAAATLDALADALQDRLAAAREVENERAKPRIVVRQVSLIVGVVLAFSLVTSPAYFAPYRHGWGPAAAVALAAVYFGALLKLRSTGRPPARPRLPLVVREAGAP